ncbi:hypothetical protein [Streptomyces sp. SudanB25_2051]|uniref:hypothetical protein n=1 Tax=Streptomyces sp. SudanB25_2051 TaxID=3035275 RepID=UPI003F56D5FA
MTITPTVPERAAAQAYLRLVETARAVLSDPGLAPLAAVHLASPMAEADEALRRAGLSGNEARLLRLAAGLREGTAPGACQDTAPGPRQGTAPGPREGTGPGERGDLASEPS